MATCWAPALVAPGDPQRHLLIPLSSHTDPPDGITITATRGSGETETKCAPKALGAGRAGQSGPLAARAPALRWVRAEHLVDRLHLTKALGVPPSLHGPSGLTKIQAPGGPARGPLTPCCTPPRPPALGPQPGWPGGCVAGRGVCPTRPARPPSCLPCFPERLSAPRETQARSSLPAHLAAPALHTPSSPRETNIGDAGLPRGGLWGAQLASNPSPPLGSCVAPGRAPNLSVAPL